MDASRNLRGIVAMLLAVGCFSLMDGGLKHLAGHYPPMQVAALRGLSALPLVTLWVLASGRFHTLWRVRWGMHVLRAGMSVGMLAAFAYRSEEHTSELQSRENLVCRLLLEKKK